jgi:urease accessory protein
VQDVTFTLAEGSRLEFVPEQIIAYRDAHYRQVSRVVAHPTAQCFIGEIVTPGWDPDDVRFSYAGMRLSLQVRSEDGGAVCSDNVHLRPRLLGESLSGLGHLEGASHMGSALILGPHTDDAYTESIREVAAESGLDKVGVTAGSRHGVSWVMVRALANSTDQLNRLLSNVNAVDRLATTGQERMNLRRY